MSQDELRRAPRVRVCCRVEVRQPHALWSAVTGDLSARGCRIVTPQLSRQGSRFAMTLSSDLFPEELVTIGEVVWASEDELGVLFLDEARRNGSLSPAAWLERVVHHGRPHDGAPRGNVVPVVRPARPRTIAIPILSSRRRSG